ncbi:MULTISPECIES: endonuclease/exonuclease/phosphatase family protein [Micromonospora]|uniref:Endonuclease n=1 Tax=Micromonospora solifontis TaxID=2487138 RepID=A0ABX9WAV3_9ACTN|nr:MULTISPECIES: endonuclease/exonuclease/phosphatase family protein [Micromonospora]NES14046.1 endonuclease [Micromonospora sp. PPF5-17B]NES39472.1 endonuclease [Micromonospora solifontis]NES56077.1 endonuclease [Micromonospora sp. PPF5-6]RNL88786.1 endonuclease [Micromonospora solifontis]
MRHRHLPTVALALGVVVLLDVLRVWLPSIITIFGRAAETPAELLGAFALSWFLLALAAPALVRRLGAGPVGLVAAGLLAAVRLALTAAPGGRPQLWLACAGLLAGLVWLAATAARVDRPVAGLALGLAGAAVGHALLATEDLVWRGGVPGWALSVLLVLAFLAASAASRSPEARQGTPAPTPQDPPADPALRTADEAADAATDGPVAGWTGARAWLLVGPALFVAGQLALAPALWSASYSYRAGSADFPGLGLPPGTASILPACAVGLFLLAALTRTPARLGRVLWPAILLAGAALFAADRPAWLGWAYLLAAVGLGGCLARTDAAPASAVVPGRGAAARRGYAVVGGMLVFAVASVAYYAAYDLGYPNGWVPVGTAALIAGCALTGPAQAAPVLTGYARSLPALLSAVLVLLAGVLPGPARRSAPPATPPAAVRVAAYNIRMGFGLDGRLDLDAVARVVRGARPDVVLLSEVDRGWLLNGGHDTLALLARRLRMPYVFAPAADPVWGDAVLSRYPVRSGRSRPLAAHGAPTGAQALGVTLDLGGRELAVVATHLQPPPGRGPVAQAREVAAFAVRYAAGRPLVLAGDLNTEPGEPAFAAFTTAGLVDALAAARPLPTSPADDPRQQIDHVFVSPDLTAADPRAPRSTASDHLPVAVTVGLP